jgi:hypothetical protein
MLCCQECSWWARICLKPTALLGSSRSTAGHILEGQQQPVGLVVYPACLSFWVHHEACLELLQSVVFLQEDVYALQHDVAVLTACCLSKLFAIYLMCTIDQ